MKPLAEKGNIPSVCLSNADRVGPESLINLWKKIKCSCIDILLLLTVVPNIWGRLLGRMAGVPVILATCRGGASPSRQHERWLWPLADHLLCNTSSLKIHLVEHCRLPESRITVIPNGVDTAFFRPPHCNATPGTKDILCVARFVPDKDHETLIAAFGLLAGKHSDLNLLLVGNGERKEELEQYALSRIPAGRFQFLPGQPDLRPLFDQSILLALSSCREALPNVVLEAMASGLPVVATAVGGLPDVIEQGRTGFLVPKQNPAAFAEAMETLLTDADRRAAFGEAGRKRVEANYSISAMVSSHEEIFCRLLNSKK